MLGNLKFVVTPAQPVAGFPMEILGSALPQRVTNGGAFAQDFDLDMYIRVPPQWSPSGWQLAIHKTFAIIPGFPQGKGFLYTWYGGPNWTILVRTEFQQGPGV
jgi:hypothetical protein